MWTERHQGGLPGCAQIRFKRVELAYTYVVAGRTRGLAVRIAARSFWLEPNPHGRGVRWSTQRHTGDIMRKFATFLVVFAGIWAPAVSGAIAQEQSESSGSAASDPTASTKYQDFKLRYFDLTTGRKDHIFETEGSYPFNARFKIVNKLIGVHTNRIGTYETDFKELTLKPMLLTPGELFGFKATYALGVEWLKDLGDVTDGTGTGSDKIAPLAGIALAVSPKDTVIALVEYFHSYREDAGVTDVRQTGPRLIWLHSFPQSNSWLRVDWKAVIDHEAGGDFSSTLELQLGKMLRPKFGVYGELLLGDVVFNTDAYDIGLT